jgi:lactoylglutathione lyase
MVCAIRIDHVALWVRDLSPMRRFYVDHLGAESGPLYENTRTGLRSYFLSFSGGARIELMSREGAAGRQQSDGQAGYAHVALSVGSREQVDALVGRLAEAGVVVARPPRITGDGYYEAVILDPESNAIEIVASVTHSPMARPPVSR